MSSQPNLQKPGPLTIWVTAARPKTLVASMVPVGVGTAVAASQGHLELGWALLCGCAALLMQLATNLANDAFDFLGDIDDDERLGPLRVTQAGWLPAASVLRAAGLASFLACLAGVALISKGGWPILAMGVASLTAAWGYSGGPFPLSRLGLGEAAAFLFFGVVAVTGTAFILTEDWSGLAIAASIPIGVLAALLMGINNLRDVAGDQRAGKRTLAVRLGAQTWRRILLAGLILAYAMPLVLAWQLSSFGPLLPWLSLPLAVDWKQGLDLAEGAMLNETLAHTARLLAVFGGLWALGLAL